MRARERWALGLAAACAAGTFAAAMTLGLPETTGGLAARILWSVRLPEALTALIVGGGLGLSGLLFQLVLRNPLADPYVLGVAGGSTFAAVGATLFLGTAAAGGGMALRGAAALVGGLLTLAGLMKLAGGKPETLLLGGVVANTAFAAGARMLTVWLSPEQLAYVTTFLVGFIPTPPTAIPLLLGIPCLYTLARFMPRGRGLDLLLLSDDEARATGLEVGRVRREALLLATVLAAAAVTLCGMLGFVGLVVPHLARLTAGRRHRVLVPASFLLGAAFLLAALTAGKLVGGSWLAPVGVYTSLVGAPVFLVLLVRTSRRELP